MCDYDYSYEEISRAVVVTRKVHECSSCMRDHPAGSIMTVGVGKTEGEIGRWYGCPVCFFALRQPEHTAMHLCWGWGWDGSDYPDGEAIYDYLSYCLANGETPTETGLEAVLQQHLDAEEAA